jgi:hypothetical protein
MGIEPTQNASAAPRKLFWDRLSDVRKRPCLFVRQSALNEARPVCKGVRFHRSCYYCEDFLLNGALFARMYEDGATSMLAPAEASRRIPLGHLAVLIVALMSAV